MTVEIREYDKVASDGRRGAIPAPVEPPVAVQRLDNAGGAVVSAPFSPATRFITVHKDPKADTPYSVLPPLEGGAPGADPDPAEADGDAGRGKILAADLPYGMGVPAGGKIGVI